MTEVTRTEDGTVIKLAEVGAGLMIIETALVLGVDGAAMVIGGTLLGLPIGAGLETAIRRRALIRKTP